MSIIQDDGNEWFVEFGNFDREPSTSREKLESLNGEEVRFFGVYIGYDNSNKKPIVTLYDHNIDSNGSHEPGESHIELTNKSKHYYFQDFVNDSSSMAAWCDENDRYCFVEDIGKSEYANGIWKTSGIIISMLRSDNTLTICTRKKDRSFEMWKIDTTYHIGLRDEADLSNFIVGDPVSLYYGIGSDNRTFFFYAGKATNLDYTLEDCNRYNQGLPSEDEQPKSLETSLVDDTSHQGEEATQESNSTPKQTTSKQKDQPVPTEIPSEPKKDPSPAPSQIPTPTPTSVPKEDVGYVSCTIYVFVGDWYGQYSDYSFTETITEYKGKKFKGPWMDIIGGYGADQESINLGYEYVRDTVDRLKKEWGRDDIQYTCPMFDQI